MKKIIVVTPSGRRRYLCKLYGHLKKQKDYFHEWHLWKNTENSHDIMYIHNLEKTHDWIKVIDMQLPEIGKKKDEDNDKNTWRGKYIHTFYRYCVDVNSIYIKLDDDIVWLQKDFIKEFVKTRMVDKEHPIIYANTINNNYMSQYHHPDMKILQSDWYIDMYTRSNINDKYLFDKNNIALNLHEMFCNETDKDRFNIENEEIAYGKRVCINAISWRGDDNRITKMMQKCKEEDERYISVTYPMKIQCKNMIYGNILCVHFSYGHQRYNLDILDSRLDSLYE